MKRGFFNKNFILIAGAVTLCLIVLLTCFSDNLYAKYITSVSGEDSGRVAKFSIKNTGWSTEDLPSLEDVYPGYSFEKDFTVKNDSEVKISYSLEIVNNYENLPLKITLKDAGGNEKTGSKGEPYVEEELEIGATSQKYTVTVEWVTEQGSLATDPADAGYEGKLDCLTAKIRAVQVD